MERTVLAILLFWAGVCNAQVYTATKNDCRLEFSTGGQVRTSLLLGDTRWIDISGGDYVQFFDGVQSIYLRANQIGNYAGDQIDSLKAEVDAWIALCPAGGGATGPTGPTGATGATGPTGPAGTYTPGDGIAISGDTISAERYYYLRDTVSFCGTPMLFTGYMTEDSLFHGVFDYGAGEFIVSGALVCDDPFKPISGANFSAVGSTIKHYNEIGAYKATNVFSNVGDTTLIERLEYLNDTLVRRNTVALGYDSKRILIIDSEEMSGSQTGRSTIFLNGKYLQIITGEQWASGDVQNYSTAKYLRGGQSGLLEWQHFTYASMDSTARNALTPAIGMAIFCTDCPASDASTGVVQVYNGTAWRRIW